MVTLLFSGDIMNKIILRGGRSLVGEVSVSGSKNAALPIIFACILTKGVSEIRNLPLIGDVKIALEILSSLGASVCFSQGVTYIDTSRLYYTEPRIDLVSKIRASTYLMGALVSRFGRCPILPFGGCNFSKRPIDMHVDACLALGGRLTDSGLSSDGLIGGEILFNKKSVGATVNAILMAVCARGDSLICGCACEPHIDALIDFLISCGADIRRSGEDLYIRGEELHGGSITVIGDAIEAGSYIAAGLITDGDVLVKNCPTADLGAIFDAFSDLGATLQISDDTVRARMGEKGRCASIIATPYPGFPTDLQPIFAPLMAALTGGKIIDTVWPSRFGYLEALSNFGIKYSLNENTAVIYPSQIKNGSAISPDLRGGMACIIAALRSYGESEISSLEIVQRGYENLVEKLCVLGADIDSQSKEI